MSLRIKKTIGIRSNSRSRDFNKKYIFVFEGEKTEKQYFEKLSNYKEELGINDLIHIEILEKLEILKGLGIDGVECYYPANSELMTETCVEFCENNDLLITAGSDGHGDFGAVSKGIEYYIGAINKDSEELKIDKLL